MACSRRFEVLALAIPVAIAGGCDKKEATLERPVAEPGPSAAPGSTATASAGAASARTTTNDSPLDVTGAVLRESKDVAIDGVKETWTLEWQKPPVPTCFDESWSTCACAGFAFAEKGTLHLVRERGKAAKEERLDLSTLFDGGDATLRRWAPLPSDKGKPKPDFASIQSRPLAPVMTLGDYDHDGRATEFLLTIGSEPCGHVQTIALGISKSDPTLHVIGTIDTPKAPLVLEAASDWEKVKAAKTGSDVIALLTACGDHGATSEAKLIVSSVEGGGLHAVKKERKCP